MFPTVSEHTVQNSKGMDKIFKIKKKNHDGGNSRWQLHIWGNQNIQGASKHTGRYPNIWGAFKHTGGHPNICGHPNILGVHPNIKGATKYMGGVQTYWGIQTYGWCPNMGSMQTYRGVSKHMGAFKQPRGHPNVWGHMDTPLVWHSMLSMCCVCTGGMQTSPKNTAGLSNTWGASKHMGCPNMRVIQTYRDHPNVWGHMDTPLVLQSMLSMCCVCTGAIQTSPKHTAGCSNIWGCPNMRVIQTYMGHPNVWGHMDTPLVWQSMPSMLCMYRGHQNITQTYSRVFKHMGVSKHEGHPNVWGHMDTPLVWQIMLSLCCVHMGGIQTYRGSPHLVAFKHTGGHPNICMGHMDTP